VKPPELKTLWIESPKVRNPTKLGFFELKAGESVIGLDLEYPGCFVFPLFIGVFLLFF